MEQVTGVNGAFSRSFDFYRFLSFRPFRRVFWASLFRILSRAFVLMVFLWENYAPKPQQFITRICSKLRHSFFIFSQCQWACVFIM
jgi:hypothetical protein